MKIAITVVILTASPLVAAQGVCRSYEYAELRDMKRERLEQLYCDYHSAMYSMLGVSLAEIKAGHTVASARADATSNRCAQELDRIERVLDSKFSAKPPQCPKKQ